MIKEIFEAFSNRIRSPLFGYAVFAFLGVNWKALMLLCFSETPISERIAIFDTTTNITMLLGYPILIAVSAAIIYPWVNLLFLHIAKKPTNYRNVLQAESEHTLLIKKNELERVRSQSLSIREEELIDRAKRDDKLSQIDNENIRNKLEEEIEELRKERDSLTKRNIGKNNKADNQHLQQLLDMYKQKAEDAKFSGNPEDLEKAHQKIQELEEKLFLEGSNA